MTNKYLTVEFTVDATLDAAYAAITNQRRWWSVDITGGTTAIGDEFEYRYEGIHRSTQRVTELESDKKVVWHPELECFDACTRGWEYYAGQELPKLIAADSVNA